MNPEAASSDYIDEERNASTPITDDFLIKRIAGGDEEAFLELYQRLAPPLYTYLLRFLYGDEAAEDVLQETFVAIWQGAARFGGRASVKTWSYRIAHNKAVTWLRKQKKGKTAQYFEDVTEDPHPESPEELTFQSWQAGQIRRAADQLSPNHRAVIELVFVHGFTYPMVARVLDCPVGTVKSRMSYALKRMNGLLRQQGIDGPDRQR